MSHKGFCDNCSEERRVVRLPIGGGAGVFLCSRCWPKEMAWRKERNKGLSPGARFAIRKWPS